MDSFIEGVIAAMILAIGFAVMAILHGADGGLVADGLSVILEFGVWLIVLALIVAVPVSVLRE